jgi:hypothetical protein
MRRPCVRLFFDVIRSHPKEALEIFAYYKPLMIINTLKMLADNGLTGDFFRGAMFITQILLLSVFALFGLRGVPSAWKRVLAAYMALSLLSVCFFYVLAWSLPWTSVELYFYVVAFIGLLWVAGLEAAGRIARRLFFPNENRNPGVAFETGT